MSSPGGLIGHAQSLGLFYEVSGIARPSENVAEMDFEIRPCALADELSQAMAPIRYYFARSAPNEDQAERFTRVLPAERMYAAWEGGRAVGGLGAFPFQLTVPGGRVPAAGATIDLAYLSRTATSNPC